MARNHENRMEVIEKFFADISAEDLKKKLVRAGMGRIKESSESDYVQALLKYDVFSGIYSRENTLLNEFICDEDLRGAA